MARPRHAADVALSSISCLGDRREAKTLVDDEL
jgi:hypothetical protein